MIFAKSTFQLRGRFWEALGSYWQAFWRPEGLLSSIWAASGLAGRPLGPFGRPLDPLSALWTALLGLLGALWTLWASFGLSERPLDTQNGLRSDPQMSSKCAFHAFQVNFRWAAGRTARCKWTSIRGGRTNCKLQLNCLAPRRLACWAPS